MTYADFLNSQVFKFKGCDTNFINLNMTVYQIEPSGKLVKPLEVAGIARDYMLLIDSDFGKDTLKFKFRNCQIVDWKGDLSLKGGIS